MAELNLAFDSDPVELWASYRDYTAAYERICDEIDGLDRQLRDDPDQEEGQRLVAEMSALTDDSTVVLAWVSLTFAAYIFALHGAETDWLTTGPAGAPPREKLSVVPNRTDRRRANRGRR
jgi:hypothetical protein